MVVTEARVRNGRKAFIQQKRVFDFTQSFWLRSNAAAASMTFIKVGMGIKV
jgi:hypothetical protein